MNLAIGGGLIPGCMAIIPGCMGIMRIPVKNDECFEVI